MGVIYSDYSRARIGHFFGLSGWQLATVALTLPCRSASGQRRAAWVVRRPLRAGCGCSSCW